MVKAITGHGITEARNDRPRCCAACMRGTRALQGPCAVDLKCKCHTKKETKTDD
jgi:hypothetical protein